MLKHIIDSSKTLLHRVSSWLHSSFDFSKESIFPIPTSQQEMELTEAANQNYRNIAGYSKEVIPIWQLLLDLDMEAFAQKFSDQWHKPYKHLSGIAVWDKRNRHRYVRCLHAAKTIRSGYEDIQWHRKLRYDTIVRIIEKDLAALPASGHRHFWAKRLLSASLTLKRETGLSQAQQGSNVVTPQGMYRQSNVSEWQKNNIITRIKEFRGGRFAWYSYPAWVQLGHLWADIDHFKLAWDKFSGFENNNSADDQVNTLITNSLSGSEPLCDVKSNRQSISQKALEERIDIDSIKPFLSDDFGLKEAIIIADAIGLTSGGIYKLDKKKYSAIIGFYEGLKVGNRLIDKSISREKMNAFFSHHFGVTFSTEELTGLAKQYKKRTEGALKRLFPDLMRE